MRHCWNTLFICIYLTTKFLLFSRHHFFQMYCFAFCIENYGEQLDGSPYILYIWFFWCILLLMVTWYRIIAPKTESIFHQVLASLIHTEFEKFLAIIRILIFWYIWQGLRIFSSSPVTSCLGCICFNSSLSEILHLYFVHEVVKTSSRKHRTY